MDDIHARNTLTPLRIVRSALDVCKGRYNRASGRPILPKVISYSVTWRCDARCKMCDNPLIASSLKNEDEELSADEIRDIFQDTALQQADLIRFTGGEPFLKKDLTEIAKAIHDNTRDAIFYVTTNGSRTERIIEFIKEVSCHGVNLHMQVSLDAVGELHDRIRGTTGLYDKALRTLEAMRELRDKYHFFAGINQTILKENFDQLAKVRDLSKDMGFGYKFAIAYQYHENSRPPSPAQARSQFSYHGDFSTAELEGLYEEQKRLNSSEGKWRHDRRYVSSHLWQLSELYLYRGGMNRILHHVEYPKPTCMAMFAYFRLFPNGDVVPCTLMSEPAGNVRHQTFSDIWYSARASEIRDQVKLCKGCWVECDILPSAIFSGDILPWSLRAKLGLT